MEPAAAASTRERGSVEDLIAKRLRPLNKKIQRFRNYNDQPTASLNADQRAALDSLPQLEAVARELEELCKLVEDAELVAAARAREIREAADRDFEDRVEQRIAAHQLALADKVAPFLALHSLLHPARPGDHANLTFAPLTLPLRLQDHVLATDILRVGRMYDDLTAGGEVGHAMLTGLATGATGDDDEDDRIHSLLAILVGPEPERELDTEAQSMFPEPAESTRDYAESVAVSFTGSSSDSYNVNGSIDDPQRTPVTHLRSLDGSSTPASASGGGGASGMTRGMQLNFLQEDELAAPPSVAAYVASVSVQHEYEVVEPSSAPMSEPAESIATTPVRSSTPTPPAAAAPLDWSAEHDEATEAAADAAPAQRLDAALTPGASAGASASASGASTPGLGLVEAVAALSVDGAAPAAAGTRTPPTGQRGSNKGRKPQQQGGRGGKAGGDGEQRKERGEPRERAQGRGRPSQGGQQQQQQQGGPSSSGPVVDADGFEVKVTRRASAAQRGRGGPGGASGGGGGAAGRGGRGGARGGSNAGGAPREPRDGNRANGGGAGGKDASSTPRKPREGGATGNGKKEGGGGGAGGKKDETTPKTKPSIYKTTQPTGPASAPIF